VKAKGMLVVMSGPSGAGKGTLSQALLRAFPSMRFSVSATTRQPRPGEVPGRDYIFLDEDEFQRLKDQDAFLEWAEVYGNLYGTPGQEVDRLLEKGYDVLLDIDTKGAMQVRSKCPEAVLIFVVAPSMEELGRRLRGRGTESTASLNRRLEEARSHMALIGQYDYVVINDGLDEAVQRLCAIVTAERCRVSRQDPESLMRLSR